MKKGMHNRIMQKVITWLVIISFVPSNYVFGVGRTSVSPLSDSFNKPQETAVVEPVNLKEILDLNIPENFGTVKEKFSGPSDRVIVHVQDSHCNYESQTNFAAILKNLKTTKFKDDLNLIAVEGATGEIDLSPFDIVKEDETKEKIAQYFMREGMLTGSEYYALFDTKPMEIYGIENEKLYIENYEQFLKTQYYKQDALASLDELKGVLKLLRGKVFGPDMLDIAVKSADYEDGKIKFTEYCRYLRGAADKHRVDWKRYHSFKNVIESMGIEEKTDMQSVNGERGTFIAELQKKMVKEELSELVKKSLFFRIGKIPAADFYAYLLDSAAKTKLDMSKYKNLVSYIQIVKLHDKVNPAELFFETDQLLSDIKEKAFRNVDERTFDLLLKNVKVTEKLLNLELTRDDLAYLKEHRTEIDAKKFLAQVKAEITKLGLPIGLSSGVARITDHIAEMEGFYKAAIERDTAIVENTLAKMEKEGQKAVILVTGGFHSKGIMEKFKAKGISYIVVSPRMTAKYDPAVYMSRMLNEETAFEKLIQTAGTRLINPSIWARNLIIKAPLKIKMDDGTVYEVDLNKYKIYADEAIKVFNSYPQDKLAIFIANLNAGTITDNEKKILQIVIAKIRKAAAVVAKADIEKALKGKAEAAAHTATREETVEKAAAPTAAGLDQAAIEEAARALREGKQIEMSFWEKRDVASAKRGAIILAALKLNKDRQEQMRQMSETRDFDREEEREREKAEGPAATTVAAAIGVVTGEAAKPASPWGMAADYSAPTAMPGTETAKTRKTLTQLREEKYEKALQAAPQERIALLNALMAELNASTTIIPDVQKRLDVFKSKVQAEINSANDDIAKGPTVSAETAKAQKWNDEIDGWSEALLFQMYWTTEEKVLAVLGEKFKVNYDAKVGRYKGSPDDFAAELKKNLTVGELGAGILTRLQRMIYEQTEQVIDEETLKRMTFSDIERLTGKSIQIAVPAAAPVEYSPKDVAAIQKKIMLGQTLSEKEKAIAAEEKKRYGTLVLASVHDAAKLSADDFKKWEAFRVKTQYVSTEQVALALELHQACILRGDVERAKIVREKIEFLQDKDADGNIILVNQQRNKERGTMLKNMEGAEIRAEIRIAAASSVAPASKGMNKEDVSAAELPPAVNFRKKVGVRDADGNEISKRDIDIIAGYLTPANIVRAKDGVITVGQDPAKGSVYDILLNNAGGACHITVGNTTYILVAEDIQDGQTAIAHEKLEIKIENDLKKEEVVAGLKMSKFERFKSRLGKKGEKLTLEQAAHILAWAQQVGERGWTDVGHPEAVFVRNQIDGMGLEDLLSALSEDRALHQELVRAYLGEAASVNVLRFERSARLYMSMKGIEAAEKAGNRLAADTLLMDALQNLDAGVFSVSKNDVSVTIGGMTYTMGIQKQGLKTIGSGAIKNKAGTAIGQGHLDAFLRALFALRSLGSTVGKIDPFDGQYADAKNTVQKAAEDSIRYLLTTGDFEQAERLISLAGKLGIDTVLLSKGLAKGRIQASFDKELAALQSQVTSTGPETVRMLLLGLMKNYADRGVDVAAARAELQGLFERELDALNAKINAPGLFETKARELAKAYEALSIKTLDLSAADNMIAAKKSKQQTGALSGRISSVFAEKIQKFIDALTTQQVIPYAEFKKIVNSYRNVQEGDLAEMVQIPFGSTVGAAAIDYQILQPSLSLQQAIRGRNKVGITAALVLLITLHAQYSADPARLNNNIHIGLAALTRMDEAEANRLFNRNLVAAKLNMADFDEKNADRYLRAALTVAFEAAANNEMELSRELLAQIAERAPPQSKAQREARTALDSFELGFIDPAANTLYLSNDAGRITAIALSENTAPEVLSRVKARERALEKQGRSVDSYAMRQALMRMNGRISTADAYTKDDLPKDKADAQKYLDDPANWLPRRRAMQEQILADEMEKARALSGRLTSGDQKNVIIAFRGNTAAGKTTAAKQNDLSRAAIDSAGEPSGALNPDTVKGMLRGQEKDEFLAHTISHAQSHMEGASITRRMSQKIDEERLSKVIDKRLEQQADIIDIISNAQETGKTVTVLDIDAPLDVSARRVLGRRVDADSPLVPFKAVEEGFDQIRKNRLSAIEQARQGKIKNYVLYAYDATGNPVVVMQIKNGKEEIFDQKLFDEVTSPDTTTAIESAKSALIDDAYIDGILANTPEKFKKEVRLSLEPYKGFTLGEALDLHAKKVQALQDLVNLARRLGLGAFEADIIAQHDVSSRISFMSPDADHISRVIANGKQILKNKALMDKMREYFGDRAEEVALAAMLLSKIGFAKVDPRDRSSYMNNRLFAMEMLTAQKDNLMSALGLSERQFMLFASAVKREGTFGAGTEYTPEKYDNPLTVLLTLASEMDISKKRLQNWQNSATLMNALIDIATDRALLEMKKQGASKEELDRLVSKLVQDSILNNSDFANSFMAEMKGTESEKEKLLQMVRSNIAGIDSRSYLYYVSSYGIEDISVDENGQILVETRADLARLASQTADYPEIVNFHYNRITAEMERINKSQQDAGFTITRVFKEIDAAKKVLQEGKYAEALKIADAIMKIDPASESARAIYDEASMKSKPAEVAQSMAALRSASNADDAKRAIDTLLAYALNKEMSESILAAGILDSTECAEALKMMSSEDALRYGLRLLRLYCDEIGGLEGLTKLENSPEDISPQLTRVVINRFPTVARILEIMTDNVGSCSNMVVLNEVLSGYRDSIQPILTRLEENTSKELNTSTDSKIVRGRRMLSAFNEKLGMEKVNELLFNDAKKKFTLEGQLSLKIASEVNISAAAAADTHTFAGRIADCIKAFTSMESIGIVSKKPIVGVIGDIHGALDRLKEIMRDLHQKGVTHYVFTGDFMDRGRSSLAAVEEVLNNKDAVALLGNHDIGFIRGMMAIAETPADQLSVEQVKMFQSWLKAGGIGVLSEAGFPFVDAEGALTLTDENNKPLFWISASQKGVDACRRIIALMKAPENAEGYRKLEETADMMRKKMSLYHLDDNLTFYVHAGLPVDDQGNLKIEYGGKTGLAALDQMQADLRSNDAAAAARALEALSQKNSIVSVGRAGWQEKLKGNVDSLLVQIGALRIVVGHEQYDAEGLGELGAAFGGKIIPDDFSMSQGMGGHVIIGKDGIDASIFKENSLEMSTNKVADARSVLVQAKVMLAQARIAEGKDGEVREEAYAALKADPADEVARRTLVALSEAFIRNGKYNDAEQTFMDILRGPPLSKELQTSVMNMYDRLAGMRDGASAAKIFAAAAVKTGDVGLLVRSLQSSALDQGTRLSVLQKLDELFRKQTLYSSDTIQPAANVYLAILAQEKTDRTEGYTRAEYLVRGLGYFVQHASDAELKTGVLKGLDAALAASRSRQAAEPKLEKSESALRWQIVWSLGQVRNEGAAVLLRSIVSDEKEDLNTRIFAAESLGAVGTSADAGLIAKLRDRVQNEDDRLGLDIAVARILFVNDLMLVKKSKITIDEVRDNWSLLLNGKTISEAAEEFAKNKVSFAVSFRVRVGGKHTAELSKYPDERKKQLAAAQKELISALSIAPLDAEAGRNLLRIGTEYLKLKDMKKVKEIARHFIPSIEDSSILNTECSTVDEILRKALRGQLSEQYWNSLKTYGKRFGVDIDTAPYTAVDELLVAFNAYNAEVVNNLSIAQTSADIDLTYVHEPLIEGDLDPDQARIQSKYGVRIGGDATLILPDGERGLHIFQIDAMGHGTRAALLLKHFIPHIYKQWETSPGEFAGKVDEMFATLDERAGYIMYPTNHLHIRKDLSGRGQSSYKAVSRTFGTQPAFALESGKQTDIAYTSNMILGLGQLTKENIARTEHPLAGGEELTLYTDWGYEALKEDKEQLGLSEFQRYITTGANTDIARRMRDDGIVIDDDVSYLRVGLRAVSDKAGALKASKEAALKAFEMDNTNEAVQELLVRLGRAYLSHDDLNGAQEILSALARAPPQNARIVSEYTIFRERIISESLLVEAIHPYGNRTIINRQKFIEELVARLRTGPVMVGQLKIQFFKAINSLGDTYGIGHDLGDAVIQEFGPAFREALAAELNGTGIDIEVSPSGPAMNMMFTGVTAVNEALVRDAIEKLMNNVDFKKNLIGKVSAVLTRKLGESYLSNKSKIDKALSSGLNFYAGLSGIGEKTDTIDNVDEAIATADRINEEALMAAKCQQLQFSENKYAELNALLKSNAEPSRIEKSINSLLKDAKERPKSGVLRYADARKDIEMQLAAGAILKNEYGDIHPPISEAYDPENTFDVLNVRYAEALISRDPARIAKAKMDLIKKMIMYRTLNISEGGALVIRDKKNFDVMINHIASEKPDFDLRVTYRVGGDEYGALLWDSTKQEMKIIRVDGNNIGATTTKLGREIGDQVIDGQLKVIDEIVRTTGKIEDIPRAVETYFKELEKKTGKSFAIDVAYPVTNPEATVAISDFEKEIGSAKKGLRFHMLGDDMKLQDVTISYAAGKINVKAPGFTQEIETGSITLEKPKDIVLNDRIKVRLELTRAGYAIKVIGPILKDALVNSWDTVKGQVRKTEDGKHVVSVNARPMVSIGAVTVNLSNIGKGELKGKDISVLAGRPDTASSHVKDEIIKPHQILNSGAVPMDKAVLFIAEINDAEIRDILAKGGLPSTEESMVDRARVEGTMNLVKNLEMDSKVISLVDFLDKRSTSEGLKRARENPAAVKEMLFRSFEREYLALAATPFTTDRELSYTGESMKTLEDRNLLIDKLLAAAQKGTETELLNRLANFIENAVKSIGAEMAPAGAVYAEYSDIDQSSPAYGKQAMKDGKELGQMTQDVAQKLGEELFNAGKAERHKIKGRTVYVQTDLGLTEDEVNDILDEAARRTGGDAFPAVMVIASLDKSPKMVEDHVGNGFIGVNKEMARKIAEVKIEIAAEKDPARQKLLKQKLLKQKLAILQAVRKMLLVHEFSHEATRESGDAFEAAQMLRDAAYLAELLEKDGISADSVNATALGMGTAFNMFMNAVNLQSQLRAQMKKDTALIQTLTAIFKANPGLFKGVAGVDGGVFDAAKMQRLIQAAPHVVLRQLFRLGIVSVVDGKLAVGGEVALPNGRALALQSMQVTQQMKDCFMPKIGLSAEQQAAAANSVKVMDLFIDGMQTVKDKGTFKVDIRTLAELQGMELDAAIQMINKFIEWGVNVSLENYFMDALSLKQLEARPGFKQLMAKASDPASKHVVYLSAADVAAKDDGKEVSRKMNDAMTEKFKGKDPQAVIRNIRARLHQETFKEFFDMQLMKNFVNTVISAGEKELVIDEKTKQVLEHIGVTAPDGIISLLQEVTRDKKFFDDVTDAIAVTAFQA